MSEHSKVKRVVGLDVSDRWTTVCALGMESGETLEEGRVRSTPSGLSERFGGVGRMRIVLEVGVHSPWMSRLLARLGHEVLVANAGKVALIYGNRRKHDRVDARTLAQLARVDVRLLHPIHHRSEEAQVDLAVLRSRDTLVGARTQLINHVRGAVKPLGQRLPSCSAQSFAKKAPEALPEALRPALAPVIEQIDRLSEQIRAFDRQLEALCRKYAVTELFRQIRGVGPLTALAYALILEDPRRFSTSRSVGAYLGLVPRMDSSGQANPQLRITKQGDGLLRRLLVSSAHYILGRHGVDSDLRRHGEKLAARGGKIAKKKAVVAVARKLATLLHRLWITGELYDPLYNAKRQPTQAVAGQTV